MYTTATIALVCNSGCWCTGTAGYAAPAMRPYARLGNSDGIRAALRALAQRLTELEVQQSPRPSRSPPS